MDPLNGVSRVTMWLIAGLALLTSAMKTTILFPIIAKAAHGTMDEISMYVCWGGLELLWLWTLVWEWIYRDNRFRARSARRFRWIALALYFPTLIAADWEAGSPRNSLTALITIGLFLMGWKAWMYSNALHPEDQKVIDEIVDQQEELLRQRFEDDVKRRRDARLRAAIARVSGHAAPTIPIETAAERDLPAVTWTVPNGRHDPVVYFLRNGNRIKIGTTTDLRQRIRRLSLRTEDIVLLIAGDRAAEQVLHRAFAQLRVGNTEWFRLAEPLTSFIAEKVASRTGTGLPRL